MEKDKDSIIQELYKKEFRLEQKVKELKTLIIFLLIILGIILVSIFIYNVFHINIWGYGGSYRDGI